MRMNYKMGGNIMMNNKNTDICVLVDVNEETNELVVYSPILQKDITVKASEETFEDIDLEAGVAFVVDLDTKELV